MTAKVHSSRSDSRTSLHPTSKRLPRGAVKRRASAGHCPPQPAAMSDAAPQLASCGDNGLRFWRSDGAPLRPPTSAPRAGATPLSAPFASVRWFPNGKLVAAAARRGSVALYLHDTFSFLSELRPDARDAPPPVTAVDVSSGSRFVAVGDAAGGVRVWDLKSRTVEFEHRDEEEKPVVAVSIQRTAESRYLACACGSTVSLYSRASKRLVNRFAVDEAEFSALSFSPHKVNVLVAVDNSGCVTAWDITKLKPDASSANAAGVFARFPSSAMAPASDISFSPSPSSAFSFCVAGLDKSIRFFSLAPQRRELVAISCPAPVTAVSFSPDALCLAAGTATGDILTYEVAASGHRITHKLRSFISAAHAPSSDVPASTAAVRSLQFRPTVTPSPAVRSRDPAPAPTRAPVHAASASTAPSSQSSADASHPSTTKAPPPRRDSDIFSPLPMTSRSRSVIRSHQSPTNDLDVDDDFDDNPFRAPSPAAAATASEFASSETALKTPVPSPDHVVSHMASAIPPSASSRGQGTASSFSTSRRDTNIIPGRPLVEDNELSVSVADVVGAVSGEDPFADETPEVQSSPDAPLLAPRLGQVASASFLNESFAAKEMVEDFRASPPLSSREGRPSSNSTTGGSEDGSDGRRQSRSSSDIRRRLPPLPPRSLSDDAMAAHLHTPVDSAVGGKTPSVVSGGLGRVVSAKDRCALAPDASVKSGADGDDAGLLEHHGAESDPEPVAAVARFVAPPPDEDVLRKVVAEEVAVAVADLRSDVKNLHAELVLAFSKQEYTFRRLVEDKDRKVGELEDQVKQLRTENKLLRGNGRKEKAPVPSWM